MKNKFWLAYFVVVLSGCASISTNISNGNFKYASSDVSVTPFGSNYQISTLIEINGERLTAKIFASDCEKNTGTLDVAGKDQFDRPSLPVVKTGNKKEDGIFQYMCGKGMPIAYAMEDSLNAADKQRRAQAVVNYLTQPASPTKFYVAPPMPVQNAPQDVRCLTTNYPGGAVTNCNQK